MRLMWTYILSLLCLSGDGNDIEGFLLIEEVNCFLFSASLDSKLFLTVAISGGFEGFEVFEDEEGFGIFLRKSSFLVPVLL